MLPHVPVDGVWSISVYNAAGVFFESIEPGAVNSRVTAVDGSRPWGGGGSPGAAVCPAGQSPLLKVRAAGRWLT